MKINNMTREEFSNDLKTNAEEQERKMKSRKQTVTPKIVVCPPVEEKTETITTSRGRRLLKAIANRINKQGNDSDSDGSSSNNDTTSSLGSGDRSRNNSTSSANDSSNSDSSKNQRRNRSTISIRRVFQSLNLTSRSQSCTPTERRQPKKQQQPKRILRPPVTYTYVKGLSGLPTQRVPRYAVCCNNVGYCH